MSTPERRRLFTDDARFAATRPEGRPRVLAGYPILWGAVSTDRGGYVVRLLKTSARFADPTFALYHHDFRDVLADTGSGTLTITPDDTGVRVELECPDTQAGRDAFELVRTKRIRGMSFAMTGTPRGYETTEGGRTVLNAEDYEVDEVSVVSIPAFKATSIGLRADPPAGYATRRDQATAAQKLGVAEMTPRSWLTARGWRGPQQRLAPEASDDPKVLKAHIRDLARKLARAETEKETLKKATAFFANQGP